MTRLTGRPARRLMTGVSLLTLCVAALPALAQQQNSNTDLQEVVVTGQRAALEAAQNRKEQASTILDSISADDAGKLPDESVTEVLQRVPGVAIAHFETLGPQIDTNHYNAQGSNLTIRGMSQVASYLNGQNSFSANGGRALSFEDIPPELLSAIDVYKSSTADLIEGGIGGSIDLRTKMPFDFKDATAIVTAKGNYGDFAKKAEPGGSVLLSDRWNTSIGEIGALVDIAYSDYSRRSDQVEIEPYFPQLVGGRSTLIPNGFDWGTNVSDTKRLGAYEALQWKPNANLEIWQTGFRSDYWSKEYDDISLQDGGSASVIPAADSVNTFSGTGALLSASQLTSNVSNSYASGAQGMLVAADAGIFWTHNVTTDLSQGVKWTPSDNLVVSSSFQYAYSQSQTYRQELFSATDVPNFGLDLTGSLPQITVPNASGLANPANYTWYNWMDHKEQHLGQQYAWQADADYTVSETSFLRSVKAGLRVASQVEKDDVSNYNWEALSPIWDPQKPLSQPTTPASYINVNNFSNFFRGQIKVPGSLVFPSQAALDGYPGNLVAIQQMFGATGNSILQPVAFDAGSLGHQSTDTQAIYGMARFGNDGSWLFGIPFDGNFGVRVVHDSNSADGAVGYGSTQVLVNNSLLTTSPTFVSNSGGRNFTVALPSLNIQFRPTQDMHVRFAAYEGVSNPTFANLNPSGYYGLSTNTVHQITGATGAGLGNPNLKPMTAKELDASIEYYFEDGGQAHGALFYKKLHDFITYGTETLNLPFQFTNGTSLNQNVALTHWMNTSQATIEGAEIGWQQFFKFLPDPFDGLGIDFNYTYTSSESPGDLAYDIYGNRIRGLPVDFLSRDTINVTGMYSKGPVDVRLAYTWRSKYLINPSGISGTYTNPVNNVSTTYSLPQYNDAYGQLDASVSYRFTPDISFSLQAVNLANSINKVLVGYGEQQFGHSWYMTDRRYEGILSAKF